ncbi:hypothetical protein EHF33_20645 (plasmid) [Deinococcus psychrotolerans]|uniref:Terminase n=1 Tax=Deinococcus psychrotolerans TaxID=2489213 RepID=A0A3G8YUP1_9DEIO|nr:hypothetical protein [Deinococcus psychrotolerans]AZI45321.1 hypothetical protein EHF33_20645 [Deinococcus psychrotolerans]
MIRFFREVLGIEPWSGENSKPGQLEILEDMQQSIRQQLDGEENVPFIFLGEAAHGLGKTFVLEAGTLLYFHECFPPAPGETNMVLSTAPTSVQVSDLLWKDVRKLIEMAKEKGFKVGRGILPSEPRINKTGTHFAVGRTTSDSGGKGSERAQGQHNTFQAALFDEAEGIPDFFYNGMKRQFTGNRVKLWVMMANPKTRTSRFQRMKTQAGVKAYRLSLLDFPNVVHGREIVPGGTSRETFNAWLFDFEDFGAHPIDEDDPKRYTFQTAWEVTAPDGRVFPPGQWWLPQRGFLYGALGIPPEGGDGDTFVTSAQFEMAVKRAPRPKTTDLARIGVDGARFGKDAGKVYLDLDGNLQLVSTIQAGDTPRYLREIKKAAALAKTAGYTELSVRVDAGYGGGIVDAVQGDADLKADFKRIAVHEIHFGGTPHDPLKYADRVTELYASIGEMIGALSIRGTGPRAEDDLADSKFRYVTKNVEDIRREVKQLEPKDAFKKRHEGRSRDDGDGIALASAPEYIFRNVESAPTATGARMAMQAAVNALKRR